MCTHGPKGGSKGLAMPLPYTLAHYSFPLLCTSTLYHYSISLGVYDICANFVRCRGSQPLLPHLCPVRAVASPNGDVYLAAPAAPAAHPAARNLGNYLGTEAI